MNIILLTIDTLRYDFIGRYGLQEVQTPNLDRLADMSWNFHKCFAASYPTFPNRTDIITGKYGEPFHVWKPLPYNVTTFPELLAEKGYCTQLIHDTPHLVNGGHAFDFPFHAWMQVRGAEVDRSWITGKLDFPPHWKFLPVFEKYPMTKEEMLKTDNPWRQYMRHHMFTNAHRKKEEDWNAAKLFSTAARFLEENRERDNFFLWIDSFDPHEPWDATPEFMKMYDPTPGADGHIDPRSFAKNIMTDPDLPPEAAAHIRAQYFAKVSFMDKWFGLFLDRMRETGLAENTMLIVTADHGINLGQREGHAFGKARPPLEDEAHIPLIIFHPDLGSGDTDMVVQPQDLFATIQNTAGAAIPEDIVSRDLAEAIRQREKSGREIALCGHFVDQWLRKTREEILFSAYDSSYTLHFAASPDACRLFKTGQKEEISNQEPETVADLHARAVEEIGRRGLNREWTLWLKNEGNSEKPVEMPIPECNRKPDGYRSYFQNKYRGA